MTEAQKGHGTILAKGDSLSPETFETIAEVLDIDGIKLGLEALDATSHDSPGGWMERIGGLLDGGELSFSINLIADNATHDELTGLHSELVARSKKNYQLTLQGSSGTKVMTFAALVTAYEVKAPVEGKLTADVTLTISGAVSVA